MRKRIVITGLGAITALGEGIEPLWKGGLEGRSGIGSLNFENGWKPLGARVQAFDPEKYITQKKAIKVMARDIQLAVGGASLALEDAEIKNLSLPRDRIGVVVGSGVLNHELDELAYSIKSSIGENGKLDLKKFGEEGISNLFPLWLLKYLPNMSACHISILFDLQGPNNTITTGASGALQAVGEAVRIIERGSADIMLAGGAESKVNPVGLSQYRILGVLSESPASSKDPKTVYRPFDIDSSGLVVGEGSGFLVLESLEHAKKRNAKIYAEVVGFGSSNASGQKIAMQAALHESSVSPKDLDYIQACGLGLAKEDTFEGEAIEEVLNGSKREPLVSASKPVTGFTGFAAGALDLIISTMALKSETIPPMMNFNKQRRPWRFKIVKEKPTRQKVRHAMTNTCGLGGQSTAVITRSYEGR